MMSNQPKNVRKTAEELEAILDALDNGPNKPESGKRIADRYGYRKRVVVEFPDEGEETHATVVCRNISQTGMAFLAHRFIYPGTRCKIRLVSELKHVQLVTGVVKRCRYVKGTASVHEVGLKFDQPIDVAMFHRAAVRMRVLLADTDRLQARLIIHMLKSLGSEVTPVESSEEALRTARNEPFDLVVIDAELKDPDGPAAVATLREQGYTRAIYVLTAATEAAEQQRLIEAGASGVLVRPVTAAALEALVGTTKEEPIFSTLVNDPHMSPLIDAFVADLPNCVSEMERAFSAQDDAALLQRVRSIRGTAVGYGFQELTDAAAQFEQAHTARNDRAELRKLLNRLTRLCAAARPASCATGA